MSLFGDRLPIDLQRTSEDDDLAKVLRGIRESFQKEYDDAFERIRLSRVYDNVGEQLGKAVGALIDAEADEQAGLQGEGRILGLVTFGGQGKPLPMAWPDDYDLVWTEGDDELPDW